LTGFVHGGDEQDDGFGRFLLSPNRFCHLTVAVGVISFNFKGKKNWKNQTMEPLRPLLLGRDLPHSQTLNGSDPCEVTYGCDLQTRCTYEPNVQVQIKMPIVLVSSYIWSTLMN
jgi:hypothetical protein